MPGLQKVANELASRGLVLVTVAIGAPAKVIANTARRVVLTAPALLGDNAIRDAYGVDAVPWTVVLGRDGRAVAAARGVHDENAFRTLFADALR